MFTGKLSFIVGIAILVVSIMVYRQDNRSTSRTAAIMAYTTRPRNLLLTGHHSDRYSFLVEWYDPEASLTRDYTLHYFTLDATIELHDLKNQRIFLKRTACDSVNLENLYPGSTVQIYSRQMKIVDYADNHTRGELRSKRQKTFGMIKPDAVEHMEKIIQIIVKKGFQITNLRMAKMTKEHAMAFYKEHEEREFYPFLTEYMSSGPVVAMELMGENAISKWRELIGPTDSAKAREEAPDSLRAMFGKDKSYNAVHGSVSEEGAQAEASMFFPTDPLLKGAAPKTTAVLQDSTCCIVKPHAVRAGHLGDIIAAIKESDFSITAMDMVYMDQLQAEVFLEVYKSVVPEYPGMVHQLMDGAAVVLEVTGHPGEGEETVTRFREVVGPSCPETARKLKPNSLRARFGKTNLENAVHCTDLPEDGLLDVKYFFELLESGQRPEPTPDVQ